MNSHHIPDFFHLPINAQHSNNPHGGELVTDVHHHNRFTHKVPKDPLSVPDQLVDVEGHHQQEQHVGYGQVQHVDVGHHLLLARRHRVNDQSVGNHSDRAQDAVDGGEDVHEGGDVDVVVRRPSRVQT